MTDQDAFDRYCSSPAGQKHVHSKEFADRCAQLRGMLHQGSCVTVKQAAKLLRVPRPVFRIMFANYLAAVAAHCAAAEHAPPGATMH